jgi:hypothetical protein
MTEQGGGSQDGPEGLSALMAELHLAESPVLDREQLQADVASVLPDTQLLEGDESPDVAMFAHRAFVTEFEDGKRAPISTVVMRSQVGREPDHANVDLSQTWDFPEAQERLSRCRQELLIAEVMGRYRPPEERVAAIRAVALAVVKQASPLAVWWPTSALVSAAPSEDGPLLMGLLNVRMFRIEGSGGDLIMDTLGLAAIGLPDLQCHFRGLEPGRVAALLYDVGNYLFESGDVIEDGHTVEGLDPGQRWRCQRENSIVGPSRVILDINPGPPYAAGRRSGHPG